MIFPAAGLVSISLYKKLSKIEPQNAASLNMLNRHARLAHELPTETLNFTICTSCKLTNPKFHRFCTIIIRFAAPKLRTTACTHASRHAHKVLENTTDLQYSPYANARTQHAWNSLICFPPSMGARFLTLHASHVSLRKLA